MLLESNSVFGVAITRAQYTLHLLTKVDVLHRKVHKIGYEHIL